MSAHPQEVNMCGFQLLLDLQIVTKREKYFPVTRINYAAVILAAKAGLCFGRALWRSGRLVTGQSQKRFWHKPQHNCEEMLV